MCGVFFSTGEIEGLKSQVEKTQVSVKFCWSNNQYMMYSLQMRWLIYLLLSVNLADVAPGHFPMNHSKFAFCTCLVIDL